MKYTLEMFQEEHPELYAQIVEAAKAEKEKEMKDEAELLKPLGSPIPVASAFQYLQDSKILGVRTEIAQGVPPQVISIRYNMPHDTVRAIANGEPDYLLISKPFSEYTDAAQIEKVLDLQNHTLSIRTNANKIPHAQIRANLASTMQQNIDY